MRGHAYLRNLISMRAERRISRRATALSSLSATARMDPATQAGVALSDWGHHAERRRVKLSTAEAVKAARFAT